MHLQRLRYERNNKQVRSTYHTRFSRSSLHMTCFTYDIKFFIEIVIIVTLDTHLILIVLVFLLYLW
jgi:hypothetical protein